MNNDIGVDIDHNLPDRSFMPFKFTTLIPIEAHIHVCVYSNRQNVSYVVSFNIQCNYNTTTGVDLTSIVTNVTVRVDELEIEKVPLEVVLEGINNFCTGDEIYATLFTDFAEIIKDYYRTLCGLKRKKAELN